ncbi:MAG: phosphoserine phosphatase SerB [Bdellovibrionales bacterium]|nr:phosphoserine phosphatase SerB [Oligoflexia bacterium]
MNENYKLIWISPLMPQQLLEGLFQWVNLYLTQLHLKPLVSFSKVKVSIITEPSEALKIEFDVINLGAPHSVDLLREAIWSEVLAQSQPVPNPYALALLPLSVYETRKRLICFDMDSTLINEEVIDEIARTAGLYERVSEITEAAMQGKYDFTASLRERVKLFYGMPKSQAADIINHLSVSAGGSELLFHARSCGMKTAVVSGGFEFILKHFQKQLFLDQVYGNVLTTDDEERFTGEVEDPIVDAEYKQKLVARLKSNYRVNTAETVVVGDGANDILMMTEAGISVSFCGKTKLSAQTNTLVTDRNLMWIKGII